jgi:glycosyltransferase involved in cell wall biosynthesis
MRIESNSERIVSEPALATADAGIPHVRPIAKSGSRPLKVTIVTGAIAPYTNRFYDACASSLDIKLQVLACEYREPQRNWDVPSPKRYDFQLLNGIRYHASYTSHIYFNPGVVHHLVATKPDIVLIEGFSPTMALAALTARAMGIPIGVMTDGSVETDPGQQSFIHRAMRNLIVPRAVVGIGASADSLRLLGQYGLAPERGIIVPITTAWDGPMPSQFAGFDDRPFDVLFSGAVDDNRKGALFFADVIARAAACGYKLRVRVTGDGPLRQTLEERFRAGGIDAHFDGYLQQHELPAAYTSARLLLFPSRGDPWGLVANEALQCGTPVIASRHAVSGVELVDRFSAGLVLPLEAAVWTEHAIRLARKDRAAWLAHQAGCPAACAWFTVEAAVEAFWRSTAKAAGITLDPTHGSAT